MDPREIIAGLKWQMGSCELRSCRAFKHGVLQAAIEYMEAKEKTTREIPEASRTKE